MLFANHMSSGYFLHASTSIITRDAFVHVIEGTHLDCYSNHLETKNLLVRAVLVLPFYLRFQLLRTRTLDFSAGYNSAR